MDTATSKHNLKTEIGLEEEIPIPYIKKTKHNKLYLYIIVFLTIVLPIILRIALIKYEYVDDIYDLPAPIQGPADGGTIYNVNGTEVNLQFVASYEIVGKVISSVSYLGLTPANNLGPRDFALGWGVLSKEENINKFNRDSAINRFVYLRYKGGKSDFEKDFPDGYPYDQFSNNHVIPSNNKIKFLLKSVREGDVIKLKGYLINATRKEESLLGNEIYQYHRNSSTDRNDSGAGACEIIYVTDISRVKQLKQ